MESAVKYTSNILVDFNAIIDTDYGIFSTMKDKYSSEEYSVILRVNLYDKRAIKHLLNERKFKNPLQYVLKKDNQDKADEIYNLIMDNDKEYVLSKSIETDIAMWVYNMNLTNIIHCTILCRDQYEADYIKKSNDFKNFKVLIEDDFSKINTKEYDGYVLKDIDDLIKFRHIEGKNIFICDYGFNLEDDKNLKERTPKISISAIYANANVFFIIDTYKKNERL